MAVTLRRALGRDVRGEEVARPRDMLDCAGLQSEIQAMKNWFGTAALLLATCGISPLAVAIEAIPETPGFRGFVILGAGYTDLKSNLVAGNGLIDIGKKTIASVNDSPASDSTFHPIFAGEVTYTFGNRWQAFLGTSLEDAVTLDAVAQVGARRDLGGAGIVQGGILFSGIPTEVWEDPYAEGVPRDETDRESPGLRLQWDRILGSAFEVTLSYRDISIDTERSGEGVTSVTCTAACQDLLRRDGNVYLMDVSYLFKLGEGRRHLLRPWVRYVIDDRDGAAVSNDAYRLQLSYAYMGQDVSVVSNLAVGGSSYDQPNPIFGEKTNATRFAIDSTLFYRLPTASERWQAVVTLLWGQDNSDVAFNDNEVLQVGLGALYRFGNR